jgi:hypothetical protein
MNSGTPSLSTAVVAFATVIHGVVGFILPDICEIRMFAYLPFAMAAIETLRERV